jgi:serine/threonine protein kinase
MNAGPLLPRPFGDYLLTASLGQDAMGSVFRALRLSPERGFVRLRILESAEIAENEVLDAIESNGEIHNFLKNPAIARGVQMDAVEGVPFIAWSEPSGRTLDVLIRMVRQRSQRIPIEHALLIGEKVATALDSAYNTTLDGERTLHGLLWPGFVSVSDDGEIRLVGFGLASGVISAFSKPQWAKEVGPYLAPEYLASGRNQKNSDVYSVGAILFELLFGRPPAGNDALADLRPATRELPHLTPELVAVLRNCLSPQETRYQSNGELRRELGKILFSGPYSPSTFNLAFFMNSLFAAEIEAETRERAREMALDADALEHSGGDVLPPEALREPARTSRETPPRRLTTALVSTLLVLAAVAAAIYLLWRRPPAETSRSSPPRASPTAMAVALPSPTPAAGASPATAPETLLKEEVARRVAQELKKMEVESARRQPSRQETAGAESTPAPAPTAAPAPTKHSANQTPTATALEPTSAPTPVPETNSAARRLTGRS